MSKRKITWRRMTDDEIAEEERQSAARTLEQVAAEEEYQRMIWDDTDE